MTIDEFKRATVGIAGSTLFLFPSGYHYTPITKITISNNQIILSQSEQTHTPITLSGFWITCESLPANTQIYFQLTNTNPQPMYGFRRIPNAIIPN